MSALGCRHKRTSGRNRAKSALPSTADIVRPYRHVRLVPGGDIRKGLGYRKACLAHEPRYSCNGPSLTFAIIAAPNRNTKNVNTTRSRQFHDMLPSFLRGALAAINGTPAIPLETVKR